MRGDLVQLLPLLQIADRDLERCSPGCINLLAALGNDEGDLLLCPLDILCSCQKERLLESRQRQQNTLIPVKRGTTQVSKYLRWVPAAGKVGSEGGDTADRIQWKPVVADNEANNQYQVHNEVFPYANVEGLDSANAKCDS